MLREKKKRPSSGINVAKRAWSEKGNRAAVFHIAAVTSHGYKEPC